MGAADLAKKRTVETVIAEWHAKGGLSRYANESFTVEQELAFLLTERERELGITDGVPAQGYSLTNCELARELMRVPAKSKRLGDKTILSPCRTTER